MITRENIIKVFHEYKELIYKYVFVRVYRNKEVAEDITQDIFLKVWEKRTLYNPQKASLKTWIFRIARNSVIDHVRRSSIRKQVSYDESQGIESHNNVADADDEILRDHVFKQMELLSEDEKDLLVLRFVEKLEIEEVAAVLNKKKSATKVQIHRTLNKLKLMINSNG
ncbi:MAG: sigma-70 family RNA polymerase sigma factor [Candidatus Dojkabacteria bacterium]|jgi:RNA polymerase sigma-70 factor (ECF subfamily)|nr:sigma-70 family RNA polymerase sigma factor [Candidatus Dojkabacteria bacterium]